MLAFFWQFPQPTYLLIFQVSGTTTKWKRFSRQPFTLPCWGDFRIHFEYDDDDDDDDNDDDDEDEDDDDNDDGENDNDYGEDYFEQCAKGTPWTATSPTMFTWDCKRPSGWTSTNLLKSRCEVFSPSAFCSKKWSIEKSFICWIFTDGLMAQQQWDWGRYGFVENVAKLRICEITQRCLLWVATGRSSITGGEKRLGSTRSHFQSH